MRYVLEKKRNMSQISKGQKGFLSGSYGIVTRYIKGRKKTISNRPQKCAGGKKARHIRHKRDRTWQCVSCRSACPRWRMRVCRYRETISKTTPRGRGYTLMTSRKMRTRESRYVLIVTHLLQPGCWRCFHT